MGSMFAPRPAPVVVQEAPKPKPPAPMPDPESPAALETRRRAQLEAMRRGGRTSTILTERESGSGEYSGTVLG